MVHINKFMDKNQIEFSSMFLLKVYQTIAHVFQCLLMLMCVQVHMVGECVGGQRTTLTVP